MFRASVELELLLAEVGVLKLVLLEGSNLELCGTEFCRSVSGMLEHCLVVSVLRSVAFEEADLECCK